MLEPLELPLVPPLEELVLLLLDELDVEEPDALPLDELGVLLPLEEPPPHALSAAAVMRVRHTRVAGKARREQSFILVKAGLPVPLTTVVLEWPLADLYEILAHRQFLV